MSAAERFQALVIKDRETGIVIGLSISVDLYKTFLTDSMFAEGISDKKEEVGGSWNLEGQNQRQNDKAKERMNNEREDDRD